ncbi:MAG: MoxR-like ATPase [Bermanella sp.]|jgi:MoxR-like ATPase
MITDKLMEQVGTILLGKQQQVRLAVCCLLARGHLLIEDLPGVGKTTLAQALMRATGLDYQRVQFTSDLLPADVIGVSIFDRNEGGFRFLPGPIFTQLLLVDEINRASPKTQSALLEAMAESQVTAEGETRPLPVPFFVIATQNPLSQSGTFPLPESQLDRFLMRISLGYPDAASERKLLAGKDPRHLLNNLKAVVGAEQLLALQAKVDDIEARESVLDYLQRLIAFTRTDSHFAYGLSSRAALALLHCAKAWAMIDGRDYVVPEDVQVVLEPVAAHRLRESQSGGDSRSLINHLLEDVPVVV